METGHIVLEEESGIAVVLVKGEHDLHTAPALREQLGKLIGGGTAVLIDLTPATFIDSSILKVLLEARQKSGEKGVAFSVAAGDGTAEGVRRVLDVTGLKASLPILASREAGVAAVREGPAS